MLEEYVGCQVRHQVLPEFVVLLLLAECSVEKFVGDHGSGVSGGVRRWFIVAQPWPTDVSGQGN